MKIIFLDIDGVLNCENGYRNGHCIDWKVPWSKEECRLTEEEYRTNWFDRFEPNSKQWISKLITDSGAKIVISSTWRKSGMGFMQKVWQVEEMPGEIIGLTPSSDHGFRGLEIERWLRSQGFELIKWSKEKQQEYITASGIENYIIIDDDSDMTYNQRHHFVHVLDDPTNKDGFTERHYLQAKEILSKTIIEMMYV